MSGLGAECEALLAERPAMWESFRGATIFATGGTGFVGCSLLELLLHANDRHQLDVRLLVLTRDPAAFREKAPHLAGHPAVATQEGDVRTFDFPAGRFDYVVHGAMPASSEPGGADPQAVMDTIVEGTRRTLDFAATCGCRKFLFVSSGAVYGRQPADLDLVGEEYGGGPDPTVPGSAYGEGKRAAELLCVLAAQRGGFEPKIARPFAFVGPYLPLDRHFAIGNFIGDVLADRPIVVRGDGTTVRSYMYSLDMALWLLAVLVDGVPGRAYNVGSEDAMSVGELARLVARTSGGERAVEIRGTTAPGARVDRYVPSTDRARSELGLRPTVPPGAAIARTLQWNLNSAARRD
jgi:nucleoside-diphosphate-sugar epimerase